MTSHFSTAAAKLDFGRILHEIRHYITSEPGAKKLDSPPVLTDAAAIENELALVSEIKEVLEGEGEFPLSGIHPVERALRTSTLPGTILESGDLLRISSTFAAGRRVSSFVSRRQKELPRIWSLASHLHNHKVLEYNITAAIDPSGAVRSEASKELKVLRRSIVARYDDLRKKLGEILARVSEEGFAQEEIITTREGRMVIPVKIEHKNRVPGFIHSSSSSGATVFVEPTPTLDLNNEITDLQFQEGREVARILRELTRQVGGVADGALADVEILARLDFVHARAKYSIQILGTAPEVKSDGPILLTNVRHPLLITSHGYDRTIPMDLEIGQTYHTLVISGPNAGGKSVMLKSVGLLSLMAQSGIHVPAGSDSVLPVFTRLFADIGDDQSIENDLSTFSSHLSTLKTIMNEADERSLVLLDEIGTGTDPAEGSAFAAAILESLTERKAVTIATTHHGNLKAFAHQTQGIENGAMEFDQETLTPTYRFRMGIPGNSYALEMAKRLQMDPVLIERSRSILGTEGSRFEGLLMELESTVQHVRKTAAENDRERSRLERLVSEYEQKLKTVRNEVREERLTAVREAQDLLQNANAAIEKTIREIRETGGESSKTKSLRDDLGSIGKTLKAEEVRLSSTRHYNGTLKVGDLVLLASGSTPGTIETVDLEKQVAYVLTGNLRVKANIFDLVKAGKSCGVPPTSPPGIGSPESPERNIDVRGMTGDEAVQEVDRVIDRAVISGLNRIDVIHGKGTGALRKRIGEFLKNDTRVKSFRPGEWNEGGMGATIVELSED